MLEALLGDLAELSGIEVSTSRDVRLPPLTPVMEVAPIGPDVDVWQCWEQCVQEADALWPIAPESGGILARLSDIALRRGKVLLGSAPSAVALAASKYRTASVLQAADVRVVPTFRSSDVALTRCENLVAKPDEGAGCEDTRCFSNRALMDSWLAQQGRVQTHVVQPFLPGIAASVSVLCRDGQAWLLSCNRQLVELRDGVFRYRGSVLNDQRARWRDFAVIAQAVAKAIPGLAGYVGIDVLVDEGQIYVLEVNPRLTTSYAGLQRAIGCNPARLVLDLLYNGSFSFPPDIARNIVEVRLNE